MVAVRHEFWRDTTKLITCIIAKGEHFRVVTRLDGCWDSPLRSFLSEEPTGGAAWQDTLTHP